MSESRVSGVFSVVPEPQTPQIDQSFVDILQKAENLLHGIEFDTEYIDKIVSENEELLAKNSNLFNEESVDYADDTNENIDEQSIQMSKIENLMRKSKELLNLSPTMGTSPKRLNKTHQVGRISNIIEDDLEKLESKLIAEEQHDTPGSLSTLTDIRKSINPIKLGTFSL